MDIEGHNHEAVCSYTMLIKVEKKKQGSIVIQYICLPYYDNFLLHYKRIR